MFRKITIDKIDHQTFGTVLQKIASKGEFTFAYNNKAIPADSIISVSGFNGTIYSFLINTLGPDYEFKEVPGYIVLRHAPSKMLVTAAIENIRDQQLTIRGQVLDVSNRTPVKQVSVYERNQLISTLTDDDGDFQLTLNNQNGPISLTATKENYRDTSLLFLKEVKVNSKKKKRYKYHPEETVDKLGKGIARMFIGSKQRIQNMNLGGFFAFSPYQVSLTPGLSSHGMYSSQVANNVSINMLGGYTAGAQGVEIGGLFNIDRWDAGFLQAAGLFNVIGGKMNGIQVAGIFNQVLDKTSGIQVAGISNYANEVKGLQFAGIYNVAKKVKGVQLAGLVNVADSSDYPIAPINFIKNGHKSLSLSYDELHYAHLDFRSGGRVLYGLIGAGYNVDYSGKYAFDIGFGAYFLHRSSFTLDGEYGYEALTSFKKDPDQISSFRLLAGLNLTKRVRLFVGPTINLASYTASEPLVIHGWKVNTYGSGDDINTIYAAAAGGLQLTW
ncbi:MAG TPA: carboxypeptidase-like regulatory domain-containing protein [Mucilaginibacter sp.]